MIEGRRVRRSFITTKSNCLLGVRVVPYIFVLEGPIQFYELAVVPSTYLPIYVIKSHIFYMNILAIVHIF